MLRTVALALVLGAAAAFRVRITPSDATHARPHHHRLPPTATPKMQMLSKRWWETAERFNERSEEMERHKFAADDESMLGLRETAFSEEWLDRWCEAALEEFSALASHCGEVLEDSW